MFCLDPRTNSYQVLSHLSNIRYGFHFMQWTLKKKKKIKSGWLVTTLIFIALGYLAGKSLLQGLYLGDIDDFSPLVASCRHPSFTNASEVGQGKASSWAPVQFLCV